VEPAPHLGMAPEVRQMEMNTTHQERPVFGGSRNVTLF